MLLSEKLHVDLKYDTKEAQVRGTVSSNVLNLSNRIPYSGPEIDQDNISNGKSEKRRCLLKGLHVLL